VSTAATRVFLGAPAVLTEQQQARLDPWLRWLEDQGLAVVRLRRGDYGGDPWPGLWALLAQADGVVLAGFRQLDATTATWRPGTSEAAHPAGWWSSPWLQLEAGIALGLGLPVLALADEGVREGIFDPAAWAGPVHGASLSAPGQVAGEWLRLVTAVAL
jgi:hypothetical protein